VAECTIEGELLVDVTVPRIFTLVLLVLDMILVYRPVWQATDTVALPRW
jgi:hypothetical protein